MRNTIFLLAIGLLAPSFVDADEPQPDRVEITIGNARFQALPPRSAARARRAGRADVVQPRSVAAWRSSPDNIPAFRSRIAREFAQKSPQFYGAELALSSLAAEFGSFFRSIACCWDTTANRGSTTLFPTPAIASSAPVRRAGPGPPAARIASPATPLGSCAAAAFCDSTAGSGSTNGYRRSRNRISGTSCSRSVPTGGPRPLVKSHRRPRPRSTGSFKTVGGLRGKRPPAIRRIRARIAG